MLYVGVDTGGTFTDVVCSDGNRSAIFKVPSRPDAPGVALFDGVMRAAALLGLQTKDVERLVHGTTVATNVIVQRRGAVIGLLTTEGFVDVLEIGRLKRSKLYDWNIDPETPSFLAPRERRRGIPERLDSRGNVVKPLDHARVKAEVADLVERHGVQAIAVCYLFSYLNPEHERKTRELIAEVAPNIPVSLSSDVDPEYREYERTAVTAFDAYLQPVVKDYLGRLRRELAERRIPAALQIMQSRGGITSADVAASLPVNMVLSGPAGGVAAARNIAETSGYPNLVNFDMGGTSSDVSLVIDGAASITTESKIAGYPVRVTTVDVSTIGAGGGSIAWIDSGGRLRVGPHSAGAQPGPVCYGRGGTEPTVTDASVMLGYFNPSEFAMGQISLDVGAAERAIAALGKRLGLSTIETALGIHRVINAAMSDQVRLMTVQRGHDVRDFHLLAFGGAGPVHGPALAADLEIPAVLVPTYPGVLAALGLFAANVEHDQKVTCMQRAIDIVPETLEVTYRGLEQACIARMRNDGFAAGQCRIARLADLRYRGQSTEIEVGVASPITRERVADALSDFHTRHRRMYSYGYPDNRVEFVNAKVVVSYAMPKPVFAPDDKRKERTGRPYTAREAYFDTMPVSTNVYRRAELLGGRTYSGPAIVEQADTTLVVPPGQTFDLDAYGNIVVRTTNAEAAVRPRS